MSRKTPVTKGNYEIFAIDYFDGNLSKEDEMALLDFFEIHPDLKKNFELFLDSEPLKAEKVHYPFTHKLKQSIINPLNRINESNYHDYFIAYWENDLTENERTDVSDFLSFNKHLHKEFEIFEKLKLLPDKNTVFPHKDGLKKNPFYTKHFYTAITTIAAIFLVVFLFRPGKEPAFEIGEQDSSPIAIEITDIHSGNVPDDASAHIVEEKLHVAPSPKALPYKHKTTAEKKRVPLEVIEIAGAREVKIIPTKEQKLVLQTLVAQKVFIRDVDPDQLKFLAQGQELLETIHDSTAKKRFWNFLSWGTEKYNQITGEQVMIMRIEDIEANRVSYRLEL